MLAWYDEISGDDARCEMVGANLADCEHNRDVWVVRTDATLQAYSTSVGEGQQLAALLRQQAACESANNADSVAVVEGMLGEIERRQTRLADRWRAQRLCLELGEKFRLFEQDCNTVSNQLKGWHTDMRQMNSNLMPGQAEKVLPLHLENTNSVRSAMLEIMQTASELIQVSCSFGIFWGVTAPFRLLSNVRQCITALFFKTIENSGVRLLINDGELVLDAVLTRTESVRQSERDVMAVAEETRIRLEQAKQLGKLQMMATQVT